VLRLGADDEDKESRLKASSQAQPFEIPSDGI
jgi:hypothetical protein